jgi:hypothetical protein
MAYIRSMARKKSVISDNNTERVGFVAGLAVNEK